MAANISELFPKQYSVRVCVGGGGRYSVVSESRKQWSLACRAFFFGGVGGLYAGGIQVCVCACMHVCVCV